MSNAMSVTRSFNFASLRVGRVPRPVRRRGISLLEIILSIAILGGALAALSTVVMTGADAAAEARDRAIAQMLCEQQLAQIVLNTSAPPTTFTDSVIQSPDPTSTSTASLEVLPGPMTGILSLKMTVSLGPADGSRPPVQISLSRWMVDPMLGLEQLEAEEKAAAEAASGATSESSAATEGV